MNTPNIYIIAGPNGAGKTTFATKFLPNYAKCKNFVNADLIASGLSPFAPQNERIKAGRLLLQQIHDLANQKVNFAFETTLAGKTYLKFLKNVRSYHNYQIHIFFLWIPSVNLALERIKRRVLAGGHHIPATDIRRRFKRSLYNFINLYAKLTDSWYLFDNAASTPELIAQANGDKPEIFDYNLYDEIMIKNGAQNE